MTATHIPASLQRRVRMRAVDRCEYCRLPQHGQEATFHVDHVTPIRQGGPTTLDNLALACVSCSLRKGARTHAPDPTGSGELVRLFHPRRDSWPDHFTIRDDGVIESATAIGGVTIEALALNRLTAVAIRSERIVLDRYP